MFVYIILKTSCIPVIYRTHYPKDKNNKIGVRINNITCISFVLFEFIFGFLRYELRNLKNMSLITALKNKLSVQGPGRAILLILARNGFPGS